MPSPRFIPFVAISALNVMMERVGAMEYMVALARAYPDTIYRAMLSEIQERDDLSKKICS